MAITHIFVSEKQDGDDATLVRPSDWNAAHEGRLGKGNLEWTAAKLLLGAGAGSDPTEIDVPAATPTTNGTYTGNSSVNRAIPHGLGVAPKFVFIVGEDGYYWGTILAGLAKIYYSSVGENNAIAVTAPDATNFYVGNATNYYRSLNLDTVAIKWVAIG